MIGNLVPCSKELPKTVRDEYVKIYCSICASLRRNFGLTSSIVLNNEITLLVLSLREYFIPEKNKTPCPVSLLIWRKKAYEHDVFNEAAKWSILLAWFKIIDKEIDEPDFKVKIAKNIFKRRVDKIIDSMNDEEKIEVTEYLDLIKANNSFEDSCNLTAKLSLSIFNKIAGLTSMNNRRKKELGELFYKAGYIITVADALVDVPKDLKNNSFNPVFKDGKNIYNIKNNFAEYYNKYEKLNNIIKEEIKILLKKNITNIVFDTALENSIRHLYNRIMNVKHKLNFFNLKNEKLSKRQINYLFPSRRLVVLRNMVCCDSCIENCCKSCCQDFCQDFCSNCRC